MLFGEDDAPPTLSRSRDGEKPVALRLLERREDADALVAWADRDRRAHRPHRHRARTPSSTATPPGTRLKDAMVSVLRTEGRVQGLLLVSGRLGDVGTFAGSDLALLETFARHVATSLDRGRLETDLRRVIELQEELRHAAMHDPLTELPNRTLFLDRTAARPAPRRPQRPVAGGPLHRPRRLQAGQRHLRPPGRRRAAARSSPSGCTDCVRTADTAARLGGDEFAVLLHGPIDDAGVRDGARPHPRAARPAESTSAAGGRRRSAPASASPSPVPTPTSTR